MGFFTKDASTPQQAVLAPLSKERITAVLDARGLYYGTDNDGDIGGYWERHLFFFFVLGDDGEYLQVRSRWNCSVGIDQFDAVTRLVNEWNATHLWPKGAVRSEGDVLGVYAEHTVDYQHGVSDKQIDLHLMCTISTGLSFFEHLDEQFPAEAAAAKAEQERKDREKEQGEA